ncbi:stonustoxin subunit alpha-like [Engraulis encrasicolus]|uniref:stonustoxin subunit alpha-like n=1 Tax=Engraulis encrasicolus TaxID=184585 RepID=UPI002FD30B45
MASHRKAQTYPDHPDRFQFSPQVLCEQGFSRRVYWEVELDLRQTDSYVDVAVAYKSITRGKNMSQCNFGNVNRKSWSLQCQKLIRIGRTVFWHGGKETKIFFVRTSRIGVYVDHRAGILAFYSVEDDGTMALLHRVQAEFTEPLHPGFRVSPHASVELL